MSESYTLYDILQVSEKAEQEVIEGAYRRLAMKYHPDVNKTPDAAERMKEINRAYEVLRDPEARRRYDTELRRLRGTATSEEEDDTIEESDEQQEFWGHISSVATQVAPEVACEMCGLIDSNVRVRVYPYVISAVILAFRRASVGVLCEGCGKRIARRNLMVSLLLGTWGIPFGLIWTIGAVTTNVQGGEQPREPNASLLYNIGLVLFARGHLAQAIQALNTSVSLGASDQASLLLAAINSIPDVEMILRNEQTRKLYWGQGAQPEPERLDVNAGLVGAGVLGTAFLVLALFLRLLSSPGSLTTPLKSSPTPQRQQTTSGTAADRQKAMEFSKNLYPLVEEALEQIDRFNKLNDAPGVIPDMTAWRQLASDADRLNIKLISLLNAPSELVTAYDLLREWSRLHRETLSNYLQYLQSRKESYRVSANELITKGNNKWTAFVDSFDQVLKKHNITVSDLKR